MMRAIEHVFYATKCFFLYDADNMDELEEILQNIIDCLKAILRVIFEL